MNQTIELKTVGFINLDAKKPKVFTSKDSFNKSRAVTDAIKTAKQLEAEQRRKKEYQTKLKAWEIRVEAQRNSALEERTTKLIQKYAK